MMADSYHLSPLRVWVYARNNPRRKNCAWTCYVCSVSVCPTLIIDDERSRFLTVCNVGSRNIE